MPIHYRETICRIVRCRNDVRILVDFLQGVSRTDVSWKHDTRTRAIAKTVKTYFEEFASKMPGRQTYLLVTSDTESGLAIAVTARNTYVDVKDLLVVHKFLYQFVKEHADGENALDNDEDE